ncbi:MAG: M15 family metallopeptidase [Acidimicrobiia bacterium]
MTRAWRAIAPTLAITAAALVPAAPALARSPVDPQNRPTPLPGQVNGKVPASELVRVTPTCVAARAAAPSLHLLFALARDEGVALDAQECYRPLDLQVVARANATARGNAACAASVGRTATGQPVGTSMHGWGKAGDFVDGAGSLTFSSAGYRFLKSYAWRVGWVHGAWAEPGGGPCAEPWHWEWVGDGGTMHLDLLRGDAVALVPGAQAYAVVDGLGGVTTAAGGRDLGSMASVPVNWVMVGAAATPTRDGYWMVGADGGVFAFGDARFHGSLGDRVLNQPVLGLAPTPSGAGYWLVAADGGVFSFGDATFHGSTGALRLARPVTAMAATPDGGGYWLAASDGGVFTFGNAGFHGSLGAGPAHAPITAVAATPSGNGYWLLAADGGVFSFGDAEFHGSGAAPSATSPFVAISATATGKGYRLLEADGAVTEFGDAAGGASGNASGVVRP